MTIILNLIMNERSIYIDEIKQKLSAIVAEYPATIKEYQLLETTEDKYVNPPEL